MNNVSPLPYILCRAMPSAHLHRKQLLHLQHQAGRIELEFAAPTDRGDRCWPFWRGAAAGMVDDEALVREDDQIVGNTGNRE